MQQPVHPLREIWENKWDEATRRVELLRELYPVGSEIHWNWRGYVQTGTVILIHHGDDFSILNTRTGNRLCIPLVQIVGVEEGPAFEQRMKKASEESYNRIMSEATNAQNA